MYKFRLYPSRKQKVRVINSLKTCKQIYNELLELNIKTYKETKKVLSKFDYDKINSGKYKEIFSQSTQNVSDRVYKAFQNFFRRVKENAKEKGFPRFKSRVNSITYPQMGFKLVSDKKLRVSKIGNIVIILHKVPKGKIKTLTIKQNKAGQWFATFACEMEEKEVKHRNNKSVGIDVGIEKFAMLSDGIKIDNPRYLIKSEKRLDKLHRVLSRKKKGSMNRRKARFKLAKQYLKVDNQRSDFLHKLSHKLTQDYSNIVVEALNIKGMVKNHCLAKHISDALWGRFIEMLSYKAVTSGGKLIKINPRNTSKTCSKCGNVMEMPLKKREFKCSCGYEEDRDLNASKNILKVGTDCAEFNACGHDVRHLARDAVVNEAGTIRREISQCQ